MAQTKRQRTAEAERRKHNQKAARFQQYTAKLEYERRTLILKMDQLDENKTN